jgi:hypothetical protein
MIEFQTNIDIFSKNFPCNLCTSYVLAFRQYLIYGAIRYLKKIEEAVLASALKDQDNQHMTIYCKSSK